MPPQNRIFGFLKSFPKGINSDIDPLLLPPDQLSYAVNSTVRGNFLKQRPNFFNLTLVDNTAGAFQAGLFQGACYYRGLDGSIMCAVNGNLFQITISGNVATVNKIGSLSQSATIKQHSLWQAEQFLIWNDGQSLPVFYDGLNARRSLGASIASIGTTAAPFTIPAIGQSTSVAVNMAIPSTYWPSYNGLSALFNVSQYQIKSISNATVNPSTSIVATILQVGANSQLLCSSASNSATFNSTNKYCGWITPNGVVQNGAPVSDWKNILAPVNPVAAQVITVTPLSGSFYPVSIIYAPFFNQACYTASTGNISMDYGNQVTIGGNACTVTGITTNGAGVVTSFQCTPNAQYSGAIGGTVAQNSGNTVWESSAFGAAGSFSAICNFIINWYIRVTTKTGAFTQSGYYSISTSNGSGNWGTPSSGYVPNYFTVQLSNNIYPALVSGSTYNFTAIGMNGATPVSVNFTGVYNGTSQLVNCQMSTPPTSTATILTSSSVSGITSLNYIVQLASGYSSAPTQATLYNVSTQGVYSNFPSNSTYLGAVGTSATIPVTGINANISAGSILTVVDTNLNTDIFIVSSLTPQSGGTTTYATIINQTGTAGNTELAGIAISPIPELPAATIGVYGMGRNWMAIGANSFVGGDIVGGSSGTPTYNFSDAVLKVSENQFLAGGTTFKIPASGETIRAMQFTAAIDASLGQGFLQVFTDDTVFSCNAPADQSTWAKMTSPILTESLIGSGAISQDAVVQSNGDLIFRLSDGGIQSMLLARLDFNRWGNTPISKEVSRTIVGDDSSLIPFTSMIVHDNRVLMTCKPVQATRGVYSPAMVALNFDPISSLAGKSTSVWDGEWNGLNVLQFVIGFFAGVKRCFALCLSTDLTQIEIHEILPAASATHLDNGTTPVAWSLESPMLFQQEQRHEYKRLIDGEIYLDELQADVGINVYYKVDQNNYWTPWYSTTVKYQTSDSGFRPRIGLGSPSALFMDSTNNRPMREGYDFQVKVEVVGSCRFLGGRFGADLIPQPEFAKPI
jgi:hypothetical protein